MSNYRLVLTPFQRSSISLELSPNPDRTVKPIDLISEKERIYADLSYSATIDGLNDDFSVVSFSINNKEIEYKNGEHGNILFRDNDNQNDNNKYTDRSRLFTDNWGFVRISLLIKSDINTVQEFSTKWLSVLVRNDLTSRSVQRMAEYIYNHQEQLLFSGPLMSAQKGSLKSNSQKELDSQL